MERVAIYARVSTEEQARRGLSMPEQIKTLREYAEKNKMKIVDVYPDGGKSGRKKYTTRPEFMRLLADVEADKIDVIIFIKLDRWFRNIADYYEVQRILDAHHVVWRATQEDYETVTAAGRLKVNIMLSVAQDEADRTSERIKFVFEGKRERNEYIGGRIPKGYKVVDKHFVIDEETAPLVRAAFDTFLETGSLTKVIDNYPELHLGYQTARRFIYSSTYAGDYNGIAVPPIITPAERQQILDMQKHLVKRTKNNVTFLFAGLLVCAECGGRFSMRCYLNNEKYIYCNCRLHADRNGKCSNGKSYKEADIENYLLTHIDSKIELTITSQQNREIKSYKPQRDAIKRKLSKLSELYVNDLIGMNDYKKQYQTLTDSLNAIPPDEKRIDTDELKTRFFENWQQIYLDLPREGRAAFWHKNIKCIYLSADGITDFILH